MTSDRSSANAAPGSSDFDAARHAVRQMIENIAYTGWQSPPNGYPRVHPDKLGPRSLREVQQLVERGELPVQPPARRARFSDPVAARPHSLAHPGVLLGFPFVAAIALGVAPSGAGPLYLLVMALIVFGIPVALAVGLNPIIRAYANRSGRRWDTDAIEYLPWTPSGTVITARSRPQEYLAYQRAVDREHPTVKGQPVIVEPDDDVDVPTTESSLRPAQKTADGFVVLTPLKQRVGRRRAILVAAERIADDIRGQCWRLNMPAESMSSSVSLNLSDELHEIAWAVAEMERRAHQRNDNEPSLAAQERWAAIAAVEASLIDRVAALHLHRLELEQVEQIHSETLSELTSRIQASAPALADAALPDLSDLYGAAWLHEQAAVRGAGRPDISWPSTRDTEWP